MIHDTRQRHFFNLRGPSSQIHAKSHRVSLHAYRTHLHHRDQHAALRSDGHDHCGDARPGRPAHANSTSWVFDFTAATTCLARGQDSIIASVAQASDPRAGLWMRPLAYQTDAKASAASRDAFVFTVVLSSSHHASKAARHWLQPAWRESGDGTTT